MATIANSPLQEARTSRLQGLEKRPRCIRVGHKTDTLKLATIEDTVDTVETGIKNQVKALGRKRGTAVDTLTVLPRPSTGEVESLIRSIRKFREKRSAKTSVVAAAKSVNLLLLLFWALPAAGYGRGAGQQQAKEPLGSLSSVGEVFVDDSAAPAESTIFVGDKVHTGETGSAAFTMSGKGTLRIAPQSQVTFTGNYQYTAELETGAVILSSIAGPNGVILRIGNFVVLSSFRQQPAISKITRAPDGSFMVSCLQGSVGVLTADSKSGEFLQAGQSLTISAKAELLPSPPSIKTPGAFHTGWLLLGAAGAAAAGAAAQLGHGGKQSVSPSTP